MGQENRTLSTKLFFKRLTIMSEKKISDQSKSESRKSISLDWSYTETPENTSHATFNKSYGLFINGSFTNYHESQSFEE